MSTIDDVASFSAVIREVTGASHGRAEQSAAMAALIDGSLDRDRYAAMLGQHLHAYRALDHGSALLAGHEVVGPFLAPELSRVAAIEADLAVLGAPVDPEPTPATAAYCERIRAVAGSWPAGFVAHHYVRYLGDLSGGQFLRRVVKRAYDLTDEHGASYYDFAGIPDLDAFKDRYRALLDGAPWDEDERARILDEILLSYRLTTAVLDAL